MRDPRRIKVICNMLAKQWERVPDWRLAQLFVNLQYNENNDLFYCEDRELVEKMTKLLDAYYEEEK